MQLAADISYSDETGRRFAEVSRTRMTALEMKP